LIKDKPLDVYVTLTKFPKNNIVNNSNLGFRLSLAPELPNFTCYDRLNQKDVLLGGPDGTQYAINCPKGCYDVYLNWNQEDQAVFGSYETGYSEKSSICISALHSGILSDSESKEVRFKIISKVNKVDFGCEPNCVDNGIRSLEHKWQRGFQFLEKNLKCK